MNTKFNTARPERAVPKDVSDKFLAARAPFRRYTSLNAAGISWENFGLNPDEQERLEEITRRYQQKFLRIMQPKFKAPARVRADEGPWLNCEEALEGEGDCFRRSKARKRAPLRVGINVSRDYHSHELTGMRAGATLALIGLCKSRGQAVELEICYGNGIACVGIECHLRIGLPMPTPGNLARLCASGRTLCCVGNKLVQPLGRVWRGYYRFWEFAQAGFPKEYDFVLDRIESSDRQVEEARLMAQFAAYRLL